MRRCCSGITDPSAQAVLLFRCQLSRYLQLQKSYQWTNRCPFFLQDYFGKSVGPVKRAYLTYGPNGASRGIATIFFSNPNSANDALRLNGIKVDQRPMKVRMQVFLFDQQLTDSPD